MEQHPVPQHIASYEFRLVGDMTIKQFGWLSGGAIIALIFYSLPLPSLFKWPLVLFFGFTGAAFAFMPVEERPLNAWCLAFFKAVTSPTQFLWRKRTRKPEILESIRRTEPLPKTPFVPADKQQLGEYLRSLPGNEPKNRLDQKETDFLQKIAGLFPQPTIATQQFTPPTPAVYGPSFTAKISSIPYQPQSAGVFTQTSTQTPPPIPTAATAPQATTLFVKAPSQEVKKHQGPLDIPEERIAQVRKPKPVILPEAPGRPKKPSFSAKTSLNLPIPTTPSRPNILVGMLLDNKGSLIEGAILEIRNSQGMPVRALKTNKLGQFMIATPLENDAYEIETEKEGYNFDIIKIEVKGEIIPPIEIRAK